MENMFHSIKYLQQKRKKITDGSEPAITTEAGCVKYQSITCLPP
jgi:hypothetical protein